MCFNKCVVYLSESVLMFLLGGVLLLHSVDARLGLDLVCIEKFRWSQRASGTSRPWLFVLPSWGDTKFLTLLMEVDSEHIVLCWVGYHHMHPEQVGGN